MNIQGKDIWLIPISLEEKKQFYKLATDSYGSQWWYDSEQRKQMTTDEFFEDWHDGYFDVNKPLEGQCFWILANFKIIGQINYNKIDLQNRKVEVDIIIGRKENMNKGYGTDALITLISWLFSEFEWLNKIWISARCNNPRAIKVYKKACFVQEGYLFEDDYFYGKFVDCVLLAILRKDF